MPQKFNLVRILAYWIQMPCWMQFNKVHWKSKRNFDFKLFNCAKIHVELMIVCVTKQLWSILQNCTYCLPFDFQIDPLEFENLLSILALCHTFHTFFIIWNWNAHQWLFESNAKCNFSAAYKWWQSPNWKAIGFISVHLQVRVKKWDLLNVKNCCKCNFEKNHCNISFFQQWNVFLAMFLKCFSTHSPIFHSFWHEAENCNLSNDLNFWAILSWWVKILKLGLNFICEAFACHISHWSKVENFDKFESNLNCKVLAHLNFTMVSNFQIFGSFSISFCHMQTLAKLLVQKN